MTGQREALGRYRELLREKEWISIAICWTVILPDHGRVPLEGLATRIPGVPEGSLRAPLRVHDLPHEERQLPVMLGDAGPAAVLFELNGYLGSLVLILRRLSADARVYSVFWDVEGNNRVSHAVAGQVLVGLDAMEPDEWTTDDHLRIWPELELIRQAVHADEEDWQAAALAAIELASGVRLTDAWLEAPHPYIRVPVPLPPSPATPAARPLPATPYFRQSFDESPIETRYQVLRLLTERLIARFELSDHAVVQDVLAALIAERPADESVIGRLRTEFVSPLAEEHVRHDGDGVLEESPRWRRMQAALALSISAEGPNARPLGFDAFHHAELAFGDEWPQVRSDLTSSLRPHDS